MDLATLQSLIDSHPLAFALVLVWAMVWKGLALWRAAEKKERNWFIAILVVNTLGLLEIIYLFFFYKKEEGILE